MSGQGLGPVVRIALRRSRWYWIIWIVVLLLFMPATVAMYDEVVPQGPRGAGVLAALEANPTMRAILGLPYDLTTRGGFAYWRVGGFTAWCAGAMCGWGLIRLTRAEEEAGRLDLVRAGSVGRHAPLFAAMTIAASAAAVLGALLAVVLMVIGTNPQGAAASGLAVMATGWMFVGIGAITAQVFGNARAATTWCVGIVLGGLYLLRALVDASMVGESAAMWVIPLEWPVLVRPYAGERWWVLAAPIGAGALGCIIATRLEDARDYGAGLMGARPGRRHAASWLRGPFGLSWHLHRPGVAGWLIGMSVAALAVGSLGAQVDELLADIPKFQVILQQMGGAAGSTRLSFLSAMLGILAVITAAAGVGAVGMLHREERDGRAEWMLSTATRRLALFASHAVLAVVLSSVLLVLVGVLLPVPAAVRDGDGALVGDLARAAVVLLPGLWVILGVACALIGWAPRWYGLSWALVGWTVFCAWLAPVVGAPDWVSNLEPFGQLPQLPMEEFDAAPVLIETVLALSLMATGMAGYRRRAIPGV